ncbi:MAG: hypothetical protein V4513_04955 [Pseudomonadota bacterium]
MLRSVLAIGAIMLSAAPAAAATYTATLAAPTNAKIIARDISWNCSGAACFGATVNSRPTVLCQSLAKRAGRLDSFAVDGRAFAAAELERCNASAKPAPASALAAK